MTALKDSSGLEDELMNGLSIADMAMARCHIIGLQPLPNPYSMICIDVNGSGSITSYDIAKGILGVYRVWPKGVKWVFIRKDYPFADPSNPFKSSLSISEPLSKLKAFHNDTLFMYGMKIGDADGDVNTTGPYQPVKAFSDSLTLTFPDVVLPANTTLNVNVTSSTLPKYQSMQIKLVTQPGLRLVSVSPSYFSYHVVNDSTLRMLFVNSNAGSPTFTFQMATTQPVVLRDAIRIGTGIQAFALAGNSCAPPFKAIRPQLRFFGPLAAHDPSDRLLDAAPATPNPFRHYATITLHLEESTPAHVEVFDTGGRLTWQQHCQLGSGEQQVILPADALPSGGVGIYRISTPQG
ncbi:MAG TPA: hypothetical protein PKD78_13250, partial [Saprospiraceae bacterium]|nr:hypothetical protein [Saprospiraceae bacterium]